MSTEIRPILETLAKGEERDYITPEDVQAAIDAGVDKFVLWDELLAILGKQRDLGAEDASLCCFIAREYKRSGTGG